MFDRSTRIATPLVTPFGPDGAVDHDALRSLVDHLLDAGVDGLVPCGTTGEFASLTAAEQRAVIETTVEAAPGDRPVVAGVGATAVDDVRDRITAAAEAGADGALVLPPYYLTATERAGNEGFFEAVAVDSPLPILLYNIPAYAGVEVAPETVEALVGHESVVGLKDSSGDLTHVVELLRRVPASFAVYQGWDAVLVPSVYAGATGGINALSHLIAPEMVEAVEAVRAGEHDRAREVQRESISPLFSLCAEHGFAPTLKVGLAAVGLIPSPTVRPPLTLPDEPGRTTIEGVCRELGAVG